MISILDRQTRLKLHSEAIKKLSGEILRSEKVKIKEVTIVFVNARQIKVMNKEFLGHEYETDVLAFDFTGQTVSGYSRKRKRSARKPSIKHGPLWGDVVISTDAVIKNCRHFKTELESELLLYIVHGLLHLQGYNDHKDSDIKRMRTKERKLIECWKNQATTIIIRDHPV